MIPDCEWCSGKAAPRQHENFCRLGIGPDEKVLWQLCGSEHPHPPHALTMVGDVECPGIPVGPPESCRLCGEEGGDCNYVCC